MGKAQQVLAATEDHPAVFRKGKKLVAGKQYAEQAAIVPSVPNEDILPAAPVTHAELAGLVAIVEKLTALVAAPAAPRETPWITIKQAAELSGLAPGFLERLVRDKMLRGAKGGKHGAWVVRRADVEALEL